MPHPAPNPYCAALGIPIPDLARARTVARASLERNPSSYALLLVALLERGAPMTLAEVAARFAEAGVATADAALASLKRCRPARPPVYRDGDLYALDPYDADLDLWAFRLGLRPARVAQPMIDPPAPPPTPLPGPDVALTPAELAEAWRDTSLSGSWSAQRIAVCVLDAAGRPLLPQDVVAFVATCTRWSVLRAVGNYFGIKGSGITILDDGRWELVPGHPAIESARKAVRARLEMLRRWAQPHFDPAEVQAREQAAEARRAAHAAELAALRRVIVHTFPVDAPVAVVLVDITGRHLETFGGDNLDAVRQRLAAYDVIAGLKVRAILQGLGVEHGQLRLAELGPPQKSITLPSGRVLRITMDMLIRGSCGISRPLTSDKQLRALVRGSQLARLRQKLEHDARSLFALHQYGRVHGAVRLRWRSVDEMLPVAWLHRDEPSLRGLLIDALKNDAELEVVIGAAPEMADPWAGAIPCFAERGDRPYEVLLVDADGWVLDPDEVQWVREAPGVWVDPPRGMGG